MGVRRSAGVRQACTALGLPPIRLIWILAVEQCEPDVEGGEGRSGQRRARCGGAVGTRVQAIAETTPELATVAPICPHSHQTDIENIRIWVSIYL